MHKSVLKHFKCLKLNYQNYKYMYWKSNFTSSIEFVWLSGQWVVADIELPSMGKLVLYGVLELDGTNGTKNFVLNCTYIVILGGRLIVGWPDKPFPGKALILLHGEHSTPRYPTTSGPPVGSKAIGIGKSLLVDIAKILHWFRKLNGKIGSQKFLKLSIKNFTRLLFPQVTVGILSVNLCHKMAGACYCKTVTTICPFIL